MILATEFRAWPDVTTLCNKLPEGSRVLSITDDIEEDRLPRYYLDILVIDGIDLQVKQLVRHCGGIVINGGPHV